MTFHRSQGNLSFWSQTQLLAKDTATPHTFLHSYRVGSPTVPGIRDLLSISWISLTMEKAHLPIYPAEVCWNFSLANWDWCFDRGKWSNMPSFHRPNWVLSTPATNPPSRTQEWWLHSFHKILQSCMGLCNLCSPYWEDTSSLLFARHTLSGHFPPWSYTLQARLKESGGSTSLSLR